MTRCVKFSDDPALETYLEKTLAARIDLILSDPLLGRIYRDFGGAVFRRSSVYHGLRRFLREQEIWGGRCLEIGSWNGIAAAVLSEHFDQVISIDVVDNPVKHEIAKRLTLNIEFLHVAQAVKPAVVRSLKFDFAYLDGDHAGCTRGDFELVKRCGRVLFHEYWPAQPPVYELVNSLGPVATGGTCFALWRAG
jgi:hypothetical protein